MEDAIAKTYCHQHPNTETALRCNKCEAYICPKCAVRTPTGYSCKSCIKSQQKIFDNSKALDGVFAVAVAGALSFIGSLLAGFSWWVTLFLGPLAGIVIGEAVRLVTGKRRSQKMFKMVLIATIVGALPLFLYNLGLMILILISGNLSGIFQIINAALYGYYGVMVATSTYYRVSGQTIRFRR